MLKKRLDENNTYFIIWLYISCGLGVSRIHNELKSNCIEFFI